MRRIRALSVVIFVIAVILFGLNKFNMWRNDDSTGPVISMEQKSVTVSVNDGDEAILKGITAIDEKDGDVSDLLIVEAYSNFIEDGRRNVTIAAFDRDNHVTKEVLELVYSDYRDTRFTLSEPLRFPKNTSDILTYLGAEDVLDGTLTSNIKISTDYNIQVDTEGFYNVVFTVSNSAGDVEELPVTVEIYDQAYENQRPQIKLSEYIVYTKAGQGIDPWNYVNQINIGQTEYIKAEDGVLHSQQEVTNGLPEAITAADVQVTNPVDINTAGVYEVIYQLDPENREPGSVRLIVVVE